MGSSERRIYGHGDTFLDQAIAAHKYFVASGRDWSPWSCKPYQYRREVTMRWETEPAPEPTEPSEPTPDDGGDGNGDDGTEGGDNG